MGLFQSTLDIAVARSTEHLNDEQAATFRQHMAPVRRTYNFATFLLSSIFVVYFALYKASTFRRNYVMLGIRVLVLLLYTPVLLYFECYIDAVIVFVTLIARFLYLAYWAYRYRSVAFLLLNTDKLAFVCGKYWYYNDQPYLMMVGGEHYVHFGDQMIPFVVAKDLYVALRGRKDDDVPLIRRVELINGSFIYIFAQEPVVGVVNMCFSEIQLYEEPDAVLSE
uniref:Nonstructural protein 3 n=1 Tax=Alphacoronavirus sp. TaxID=1906673 RepID=A0A8F0ZWJ5_9ALPC|nr:nonstructural protein 3 [Alphacoronavirus sp.]